MMTPFNCNDFLFYYGLSLRAASVIWQILGSFFGRMTVAGGLYGTAEQQGVHWNIATPAP